MTKSEFHVFFFFQAEDGIRDDLVTGVQTCALPISSFSTAGNDPDKPAAVCVYLWARDPKLCDGPYAAGAGFDASRTEGQIVLPSNVRCTFGRSEERRVGKECRYTRSPYD